MVAQFRPTLKTPQTLSQHYDTKGIKEGPQLPPRFNSPQSSAGYKRRANPPVLAAINMCQHPLGNLCRNAMECIIAGTAGEKQRWGNYVNISFHIEWDMIVVTVFLSILN